jgi:aspartyl/asparaginyl beta-hydroxylase (cupin superfamily)
MDNTNYERLEKDALKDLVPTPIEDAPMSPSARFAMVQQLLASGRLPKSIDPARAPALFYPGLRRQPIYDTAEFPWAASILAHAGDFVADLAEVEAARAQQRLFHTVWPDFTTTGEWAALWLRLYGEPYAANAAICERTLAAIDRVPGQGGWLGFSAMAPGTHIAPHCGVTNAKLRCHVPLDLVPGGSRIRIGDAVHAWTLGQLLVFDDSYEHEVWNDSAARRVILIFDIFHPDLTGEEVAFLKALEARTVKVTYNALMQKYLAESSNVAWVYGQPR